jgi:hypothetical protein
MIATPMQPSEEISRLMAENERLLAALKADKAELSRLTALISELREALNWYSEKATSLAEKDWRKNPQYAEAIFVELSLDGGRRARSVLSKLGEG